MQHRSWAFATFLALLACALTPGAAPAQTQSQTQTQISGKSEGADAFIDHFETLDEAERWYISDGWSNGDWMSSAFRRSHIALAPEGLVMTLARNRPDPLAPVSTKPYSGAEIRTHRALGYGYFEARMRAPSGSGLITGFFTYAPHDGAIAQQEIDVEILGRDTRRAELNIHNGARTESVKVDLPFDAADGFHTYGIDWRPKSVRWYIDGKLVHQMRGKRAPIPNRPQTLLIDLWNSERLLGWSGGMKASEKGPWTLTVSCVAYAARYAGRPLCTGRPAP